MECKESKINKSLHMILFALISVLEYDLNYVLV